MSETIVFAIVILNDDSFCLFLDEIVNTTLSKSELLHLIDQILSYTLRNFYLLPSGLGYFKYFLVLRY